MRYCYWKQSTVQEYMKKYFALATAHLHAMLIIRKCLPPYYFGSLRIEQEPCNESNDDCKEFNHTNADEGVSEQVFFHRRVPCHGLHQPTEDESDPNRACAHTGNCQSCCNHACSRLTFRHGCCEPNP